MSLKSILSVIRPDEDQIALTKAVELARAANGYLNILVADEMPVPMVSAYDMVNTDIWARQSDEARAAVKDRTDAVEKLLAQDNVKGSVFGTVAQAANFSDVVGRAARYNDLTFILSGEDTDKRLREAVIGGALFESGSPILMCSKEQTPNPAPERVVIGWNATPQSGRAVRGAIDILKFAQEVTAVLVDPEPSFTGHGEEPGANIAAYLGRHGISAEITRLPSQGQSVEDILRRSVSDTGAEMLVIGGYSHSRLRQRIFGGTTSSIMERPPCPIFMAH